MATNDEATTQDSWNAGLYDNKFSFIWEYGSSLIDLLDPKPGEYVLDIGCGTGHLTHAIAERGARVIGNDFSAAMIEQARANYPDLRFEVADASNFTLDEPVDAIFSNAVFHWVHDQEGAAACIQRALKPGGRFVAEFGGKGNVGQIIAATISAMHDAGYANAAERTPWYYPSIGEHATLLERLGLETISAVLFDRPTLLDGGEAGLSLWLEMFGDSFFANIPPETRQQIVAGIEERLRPALFRDGSWYADYRRLRIVAIRPLGVDD
jgi:trans-aconitate methyltransferase